ncbi:MAG: hypothetical protein R3D25_10395 [Geminicoccaceae bacterium]
MHKGERPAVVDLDLLEARLLGAALAGRAETYGSLLAFFERRVTPVTVAALCKDLGRVCTRIEALGGPDLACLVVRASDGLPGAGYFTSLREAGLYVGEPTGPEAERYIAQAQRRAGAWARRLQREARRG